MMAVDSELRDQKKMKRDLDKAQPLITILVIDDDIEFLDVVRRQVAQIRGVRIECAKTCDEAVERLATRHINLVICDWALAKRTGPEVFWLADPLLSRRSLPKIPVMFMSGSEKVSSTLSLRTFKNFEPVTFILKNLGPRLIRVMAENVLQQFYDEPGNRNSQLLLS